MSLRRNTSSLAAIQFAAFFIPLLQIPHLTRVFGLELYGLIVLGASLMQISQVVIDYGFSISLPGRVASQRNSNKYLGCLLGSVSLIKFILSLGVMLAVFLFCYFSEQDSNKFNLFFLYVILATVVSMVPVWLFQGLESMWVVAISSLVSRIASLGVILLFISNRDDIIYVPLVQIISQILLMIWILFVINKKGIKIGFFDANAIKKEFFEAFDFFVSRLAVAIYSPITNFAVALVAGERGVAIYGAAEQLYRASQQIFQPVGQALYPYMVRTKNFFLYKRIFAWIIFMACMFSFFGFFVADKFIIKIYGNEFYHAFDVYNIFSATLIFYVASMMLGYPILSSIGCINIANRSVIFGGLTQIIMLCILYIFGVSDLRVFAVTVLVAELVVFFQRAAVVYRYFMRI